MCWLYSSINPTQSHFKLLLIIYQFKHKILKTVFNKSKKDLQLEMNHCIIFYVLHCKPTFWELGLYRYELKTRKMRPRNIMFKDMMKDNMHMVYIWLLQPLNCTKMNKIIFWLYVGPVDVLPVLEVECSLCSMVESKECGGLEWWMWAQHIWPQQHLKVQCGWFSMCWT